MHTHIFLFFYFSIFYIFYYFWGWAGPGPARSLAQASDPAGLQARVVQTTLALHRAKVIKLPSPRSLLYKIKCT
jgi:hypothetical protein